MNEASKNQLKSFLKPGSGILLLAVFLFLMSFTALAAISDGEPGVGLLMLVLFLVPAAIIVWSYVSSVKTLNTFISSAEASGAIEDLINDFNNGIIAFNGHLRFGNTYVMGERGCVAFTYSQITKIYQYEHRTNGATDRRELQIVASDGKTYTLCKLPIRGANPDDLMRLFAIIKTKNPSVHLGYR